VLTLDSAADRKEWALAVRAALAYVAAVLGRGCGTTLLYDVADYRTRCVCLKLLTDFETVLDGEADRPDLGERRHGRWRHVLRRPRVGTPSAFSLYFETVQGAGVDAGFQRKLFRREAATLQRSTRFCHSARVARLPAMADDVLLRPLAVMDAADRTLTPDAMAC
jgi:hypothetical protein